MKEIDLLGDNPNKFVGLTEKENIAMSKILILIDNFNTDASDILDTVNMNLGLSVKVRSR